MNEKLLAHFEEQAGFCAAYGSPFTGALIAKMAEDFAAGGPMAALVGDWPTNPRADALALRLTGYLHNAVLSGKAPELAAVYPARLANWSMEQVWPVARALIDRDAAGAREFMRSPPQTNETRRSIALLAGFLAFAKTWNGDVDMLEIGASAGLNLNWDLFTYRARNWAWGVEGPVVIDTDWHGEPPPIEADISVRHRAACDLNPLDVRDETQRLQLKSYIWPDQADRLARFDGAVGLALDTGVRVDRADAAIWLTEKLASRAADAATIVYHSIFLQYPPREGRAAIIDAIEQAGLRATGRSPLAWVRVEPEALLDKVENSPRMVIDLITWPGGRRRILGYTDGHVRRIDAL